MRTSQTAFGKLAIFTLIFLAAAAAGYFYFTTQRGPSQTTESNKPLDWKSEFGRANSQEKDLHNFIETVVERSAPPGYALGRAYGDSRDIWVDDLNSDGQSDLAFSLTTTPSTANILRIVTPLRLDGTSEKVAEMSSNDLDISTAGRFLTGIEGSIDFNHDGEKELLIEADANKPTNEILKIDFTKKTISRIQARTSAGDLRPVRIVGAGGFGYMIDQFLGDVDRDGIDDFVCQDRQFTDVSNETIKSATFTVFKWNGTLFDYSKSLSDQLTILFDPAKDVPVGAWPQKAPLPR